MVVKKCVSKNNLGNRVGPEYYFLFDINKKSITDTLTSEQIKQDIRDNKYTVINYHITPAGRLEHNNPKDNDYVDNYLTKNFDTRFDKLEQKLKKTAPALTFKWSLADEAVPMLFLREDNITQVDVVYTINCYIQGVKIRLFILWQFCTFNITTKRK